MNLCRPDNHKSCAACCGLYNVADATRDRLLEKLLARTTLFAHVERSADSLTEFAASVAEMEGEAPLESAIHVCEFTGFLDDSLRTVGCLLHPSSPGNDGVDLRGLCHYGSMACKSFFCPAWAEVPHRYLEIVSTLVDDWHLYGLVITDADFLNSIFGLLEDAIGQPLEPETISSGPAADLIREILTWKDTWPLRGPSLKRRSRHYFKSGDSRDGLHYLPPQERIVAALDFTFGVISAREAGMELIDRQVRRVTRSCISL